MKLHNTIQHHPILASLASMLAPDNVIVGKVKFHIHQHASLKLFQVLFRNVVILHCTVTVERRAALNSSEACNIPSPYTKRN